MQLVWRRCGARCVPGKGVWDGIGGIVKRSVDFSLHVDMNSDLVKRFSH